MNYTYLVSGALKILALSICTLCVFIQDQIVYQERKRISRKIILKINR